tara:strand:+ start:64848 stop:68807 length:3960 start_codon:yes stop_codon:yes gene_type:complete
VHHGGNFTRWKSAPKIPIYIQRTLWFESEKGNIELSQEQLSTRNESLVILGDAGMGKSELLKQLAQLWGYVHCTARKLIASSKPENILDSATTIVIDALDEVSAKNEGGAIDLVLAKLESLGNPRFILSCRAIDWQNATGISLIEEFYEKKPLVLHLSPFQDAEILDFLKDSLDENRAYIVIEHFNRLGLNQLLGNPQTLSMIAQIGKNERLPENRANVYRLATENLAVEHNDKKAITQISQDAALDAAGCAFASLILTGKDAISRRALANINFDDLSLADLQILPQTENILKALDSRLFISLGNERFSYAHRSIGEYLGAKWMVKQANTPRKIRRLLSVFQSSGLVPTNLRGIHAWLCQDVEVATNVIKFDPVGVIEHCGTDSLSLIQAKTLLSTLTYLAEENPDFLERKSYFAQGLIKPQLLSEIFALIFNKNKSCSLRVLLIAAFQGQPIATSYEREFNQLLMNPRHYSAIRNEASKVLSEITNEDKWESIVKALYDLGDNDSLRLAEKFINEVKFEGISDDLITNLVIKYAESSDNYVVKFYSMGSNLPIERISNILNMFSTKSPPAKNRFEPIANDDISELVCNLAYRLLNENGVGPETLWYWLSTIKPQTHQLSGAEGNLGQLMDSLGLCQQIQQLVLLSENTSDIRNKYSELQSVCPVLALNEDNIINLLQHLNPEDTTDTRWKDILGLCYHNKEHGLRARLAAEKFAKRHSNGLVWLGALANPLPNKWEVELAERVKKAQIRKKEKFDEHRNSYLLKIDDIRIGKTKWLVQPTLAYLKQFNDVGQNLPAHERIADWLGELLSEAALLGFEAYLKSEVIDPDEIANSHAQGSYNYTEYILVSAIAERLRKNISLEDLNSQTILACLFSIWMFTAFRQDPQIGDVNKFVENEIQQRGLLLDAYRRYIEPRLALSQETVLGLNTLMADTHKSSIACKLAIDWLIKFPILPRVIEQMLLNKLIQSGKFVEVKEFILDAKAADDDAQNRNRIAAHLMVDFEQAKSQISKMKEAKLLWHIRELLPEKYDISLMKWIVSEFRELWPYSRNPDEGWMGKNNSWDASQFISSLIKQIASNSTDEAVFALNYLKNQVEDGYSFLIKGVIAEQRQRVVEQGYLPPKLQTINAIVRDTVPNSIDDLQAYILEELTVAQARIKADDVDSWRGFYDSQMNPNDEERCRDHLLGLLRQNIVGGIELQPEAHVAADKRVDFTCSVSGLRLPIEIKGQWHSDLWTGADKQLTKLYSSDHLAHGYGIYLVFWFGIISAKRLKNRKRGKEQPKTSDELCNMLIEDSLAAQSGRIKIVVIDIERQLTEQSS